MRNDGHEGSDMRRQCMEVLSTGRKILGVSKALTDRHVWSGIIIRACTDQHVGSGIKAAHWGAAGHEGYLRATLLPEVAVRRL